MKKNLTLVEKAKSFHTTVRNSYKITDEHIELALAYLKGDVAMGQAKRALNIKSGNGFYCQALIFLREAYKRGRLQIKAEV